MTGREFAERYLELKEIKDNLEYCESVLSVINDEYRTQDAIRAIKTKQKDVLDELYRMDTTLIG